MTTAEKVIKTKVGLLELGKQLGKVSKAGLQPRQFLSVQGTLREGRASSAARDLAEQAELEEPDR
jgi:hypothetical protein